MHESRRWKMRCQSGGGKENIIHRHQCVHGPRDRRSAGDENGCGGSKRARDGAQRRLSLEQTQLIKYLDQLTQRTRLNPRSGHSELQISVAAACRLLGTQAAADSVKEDMQA